MNKFELRQQIRMQKRQMTPEVIAEKSQKLLQQFLATDLYRNATTLYGYMSYNQEVRTLPILEQALRDGKRVAIPKCYGDEMRFIYMEDLSAVEKSSCGIPEPIADEPVATDETALVLMPGLAFDPAGHRIGYGGGFYDKYLSAQSGHPTVALCFDFQMLPTLETEEFDIPVDLVLWA
jgi:5-formyltetrahydrofolate cyclo-ligase